MLISTSLRTGYANQIIGLINKYNFISKLGEKFRILIKSMLLNYRVNGTDIRTNTGMVG